MPSPVDLLATNLLSPIVLAFVLGAAATFLRSDLRIPDALYETLSIYLLLAIGLKGGVSLSQADLGAFVAPAVAAVAIGAAIPLWSIPILVRLGRFSRVDAAGIAAMYGSVSVVTFVATLTFLDAIGVGTEGFVTALAAVTEVPGILVALLLARTGNGTHWRETLRELLTGRSVMLLVGGLVLGVLSGPERFAPVAPLFVDLFSGALVLFLLEMGLVAARRVRDVRRAGPFLIVFAIAMPVLHATLGVTVGTLVGLSVGGATVLGILSASASYIAAPAAVRMAMPEANPGLYLTAVLAVTFPFNLAFGIPLTFAIASFVQGVL